MIKNQKKIKLPLVVAGTLWYNEYTKWIKGGKEMERLTVKIKNRVGVVWATTPETTTNAALERLAAYEDTGLTPEEIANLKAPCDLCIYGPPSAGDGKPCGVCPACMKGE